MTSRANVHRISGSSGQDEGTGLQGVTWETVHADIPFRLKAPGNTASVGNIRLETVGGIEISQALGQGYMPVAINDLLDNDVIEVTVGEWAGTVWRVLEATVGDQLTSRRVPMLQIDRPQEWGA